MILTSYQEYYIIKMREDKTYANGGSYELKCESNSTKPPEGAERLHFLYDYAEK